MDDEFETRVANTEALLREFFDESTDIMIKKNRDRGDAWRGSGLLGQYVEIYSMYRRLDVLVWKMGWPVQGEHERDDSFRNRKGEWRDQVENALVDMRNFTMLAQLCLFEDNYRGEEYPDIGHAGIEAIMKRFVLED